MNFRYLKYLTQAGGSLKLEEINFFLETCEKKNRIYSNVWSNRSFTEDKLLAFF